MRGGSQALVGEAGGAGGEVDDAAVGEAVFEEVVLHDVVVAVGVDADVAVVGETPFYNCTEDAVDVREAGYAVDYVIGESVVQPVAVKDFAVGRLR